MNREQAEIIGIKALGWLAAEEDLVGQFLNMSGSTADDLRNRAQDPEFLGYVLDFLMLSDETVIAFCEADNLPNDAPMQARMALPGGDIPNWT